MKAGAKSGNCNYERERDFVLLWSWDVGNVIGTERDTGFQLFGDKLIDQSKNRKLAEANLYSSFK